MDSRLLGYREFVTLEKKTLTILRNNLCKRKPLLHIANDADKCLFSESQYSFAFSTYWDVGYMDEDCRIFIGALVEKIPKQNKILYMSYYVCIVEGREPPNKILRKFHFDYVTEAGKKKQPHPRFHLQYGGELPPGMKQWGIEDKHIQPLLPKVKQPRIFFVPVTIALLMNAIFYEFPIADTNYIKKERAWLNIIRDNERKILVPFYERCAQLAGKDGIVFFEQVYVQ